MKRRCASGGNQNIGFTVDLLGEAVVSEIETGRIRARAVSELLEHLWRAKPAGWTDPLGNKLRVFSSRKFLGQKFPRSIYR